MGCLSESSKEDTPNPKKITRQLSVNTCAIITELEGIPQYTFKKILGQGQFGRILLLESGKTGHQFAVKAVRKNCLPLVRLIEEISILSKLDHPNIVKYLNALQSENYLYVIMEYCKGCSLFDKILKDQKLNEEEAAKVMKELLCAINHCHHFGVIHRDLKPENIMYSSQGTLKIIDFGLSMMENKSSFERLAGTKFYIAPEAVRDGIYTKACDV